MTKFEYQVFYNSNKNVSRQWSSMATNIIEKITRHYMQLLQKYCK